MDESFQKRSSAKKALIKKRILMAAVSYMMAAALVAFSMYAGFARMTAPVFLVLVGAALGLNVLFYIFVEKNINMRFRDRSMTMPQIMVGITFSLVVIYYLDQARGTFLLLMIPPFLFGVFKLQTSQFLKLSLFTLLSYGVVIGLLASRHPELVDFRQELIRVLTLGLILLWVSLLGGHISHLRLELRQTNRELVKALDDNRYLAEHDELTGVLNRRRLKDILQHQKELVHRGGQSFFICLLDLDHFKKINDRYGHLNGDLVLSIFAKTLARRLRKTDYVARYGGEEFCVILTQTDLKGALICMEDVRKSTSKIPFEEIARDFRITVSIGITPFRKDEYIEETLARADAALYRAKNKGRDRVEVAHLENTHANAS